MFCAPRLVLGGTEGVGSRFHVLRSRTHLGRYRGRQVPFSFFTLPGSFSAVPRASGHFFIFCAPGLVFGGIECVGSHIHILRSLTHFRRNRGRRVPFACFSLSDSFWAILWASDQLFIFFAPILIFGGTEGAGSHFHVLRSRTHFGQYRGRRVPFSCFALHDSFGVVPRASSPVFTFCAPVLVWGGTDGAGSYFHVLHSRTCFQRYRGRRVPFACFALPDSYSAESWTHLGRYRGRRVRFACFALSNSLSVVPRKSGLVFMFCSLGPVLGGIEGAGSNFHVLRSQTHLGRYQGRRVPFSCFALPDSFSTVPRASGPVFMFALPHSFSEVLRSSCPVFIFCTPGLILGGTEGFGSRFHVLCSRTHLGRHRGCRVLFSCFAHHYSFSAVSWVSGIFFMFCAPGLIFGGTEGVGSRIHVLRSRTHFRRYRGRRVSFSCFALPDSFGAVPRVSSPVFMFCAP
jgi:hypothetical protein